MGNTPFLLGNMPYELTSMVLGDKIRYVNYLYKNKKENGLELETCINFILTKVQNNVFNYFKHKLTSLDITPAQYAVLKCLWDNGDQLPSQISNTLCVDSSTITGILSRMEKKGLIKRMHSTTDRRAVNVQIMPEGKALQADIENAVKEANEEILRGLDPEDLGRLRFILDHINESAHVR